MLNILNLGGGIQSSVVALMAEKGLFPHKPDIAIHSDTQSDPPHVLRMVKWLAANTSYPIKIVTAGSVIKDLALGRNSDGTGTKGIQTPPVFVRKPDGSKGMTFRQCTNEYKIKPINKEIRKQLGLIKHQRWPTEPTVRQWYGISYDEIQRMRDPERPAIINYYPLVETRMTRTDCQQWWQANAPAEAPQLGRSACICCPYRTAAEWQELTESEIDEAAAAEQGMRIADNPGYVSYLHPRMIDLKEAIAADRQHAHDNPPLFTESDICDSGHCFN